MRNLLFALALVVFLAGYSADADAQLTVVVPNDLANMVGDANNVFPLNCLDFIRSSQRYQQIYASEQVGIPGNITAMNFRLGSQQSSLGGFEAITIPNLLINMSITPVEPENTSATFANNLGPVVQTVFNGDLTISAPACVPGPCPFDIVVPLDVPFSYDPLQGNLIVEWRVNTCILIPEPTTFDSTSSPTSQMNRVFTAIGDGVDDLTGEVTVGSIGLVTQFVITPPKRNVPTLSEWGLISMAGLLGIVGFMVMRRRKVTA